MSTPKPQVAQHSGPTLDTVEGYDIIECASCGFKHVNPIPTDEQLDKFYADAFYASEKTDYFKDAETDLDWWTETYKDYYKIFEQNTKGKRLLDIGSGPGYFLKVGQDLGWDVLGVEPSDQAYEYSTSLGVKVKHEFFTAENSKDDGLFDVVCLNLVLEHLPRPAQFLEEVKGVLKPGGLLFILSPNDYNPLQKIVRETITKNPWWVVPTHHLNYFDFASVQGLLKSLGFSIADCLATYPMEFFLLGGENYIGQRDLGRACHLRRKSLEMALYKDNPALLGKTYRDMAKNGIGREFVVIAKKPE
ncbi:MAG: class I SAM-dependent methyltransferase [bacterium]